MPTIIYETTVYVNLLKIKKKNLIDFAAFFTIVTVENRSMFMNFLSLMILTDTHRKMSRIYLHKYFK